MKKIFYLMFFLIIFIFELNYSNAESIDCSTNPYACIVCDYGVATFTVYSDGKNTNVILKEAEKEQYQERRFSYVSTNFESIEENKLICPAKLYSTAQKGSWGGTLYYTFNLNPELNQNVVDLGENSYNNNKPLFAEDVDTSNNISCNYENGINVIYNGTEIKIENTGKYSISPGINEIDVEDFKNNPGKCPSYNFRCYTAGAANICEVTKSNSSSDSGNQNSNADKLIDEYEMLSGDRFEELLKQLKAPLQYLSSSALNIRLTLKGNDNITLNSLSTSDGLCKGSKCSEQKEYLTEQGLKNIRSYCNEIYTAYPTFNKSNADGLARLDECVSFNTFYSELVKRGIVNDLGDGCGIITEELGQKLNYFLDILKVAGPLIALGLGTLDFIKVIANGDADKEMKTAFKRFMTRLGAAALLFIIPFILAFVLDIFMRPGDGYESDNPFCSVIDWDE